MRAITEEEKKYAQELLQKARVAMKAIKDYDQKTVDLTCGYLWTDAVA